MDSDSDFAPGAFVPEPTKKKKKKVRTSSAGPAQKKRRLDVLEKSPRPDKRSRCASSNFKYHYSSQMTICSLLDSRSGGSIQHNPLLRYFGKNIATLINLQSAWFSSRRGAWSPFSVWRWSVWSYWRARTQGNGVGLRRRWRACRIEDVDWLHRDLTSTFHFTGFLKSKTIGCPRWFCHRCWSSKHMRINSRAERGLIESDSGPELAGPIGISKQVNIGLYHVGLVLWLSLWLVSWQIPTRRQNRTRKWTHLQHRISFRLKLVSSSIPFLQHGF